MNCLLAVAVFALPPLAKEVPVVWTGGDSHVAKREQRLIDNEREWVRTWLQNRGKAKELANWEKQAKEVSANQAYGYYNVHAVPEVDFRSYVVAAIFEAPTQSAGYSVVSSERKDGTRTLRFVARSFSIVASTEAAAKALQTRPYAFFLVPRDFDVLRLEEGIVEKKGEPPTKFQLLKEFRTRD